MLLSYKLKEIDIQGSLVTCPIFYMTEHQTSSPISEANVVTHRKNSVSPERWVTFQKIALVLDSDGFMCLPYSFGPGVSVNDCKHSARNLDCYGAGSKIAL